MSYCRYCNLSYPPQCYDLLISHENNCRKKAGNMAQKTYIQGKGHFYICGGCQGMFDDYSDYIVHKQECGREMEKAAQQKAAFDMHDKILKGDARAGLRDANEPMLKFPGNVTRTKKPQYSLIPKAALNALAERFELGQIKHGPTAWNAGSNNYESALTKEWTIAGLEHLISHAMDAIKIIQTGIINLEKEEGLWENAGAIMFGGAVLAAFHQQIEDRFEREKRSQEPEA